MSVDQNSINLDIRKNLRENYKPSSETRKGPQAEFWLGLKVGMLTSAGLSIVVGKMPGNVTAEGLECSAKDVAE